MCTNIAKSHNSSPFVPVLIGNDLSQYAIAQLIHRRWRISSYTLSEEGRGPINNSRIVTPHLLGKIRDPREFTTSYLSAINVIATRHPNEKILVIPNTDGFVSLLDSTFHSNELEENVVPVIGPVPQIYDAADKATVGQALRELDLPALREITVPIEAGKDDSRDEPESEVERTSRWRNQLAAMSYPAVMKPADGGTTYAALKFPEKRKAYLARDSAEALSILEAIYRGGFSSKMLIQQLVAGDDTASWVVSGYLDRSGRLTMASSGQVIVNLHEPALIGNAGAILVRPHGPMIDEAVSLARKLGLRGPFSMDIKIDPASRKRYILDVNARIGRSCFYMFAGGLNPLTAIVADYLDNRRLPQARAEREALYTILPLPVVLRYATGGDLARRVRRTIARNRVYHPLRYWRDNGPYRLFYRNAHAINSTRRLLHHYPRHTTSGF